jgi:hypothetical protein
MATVKRFGSGYVVISELTGLPVIRRKFKTRAQATQAASELRQSGFFS